MGDDWILGNRMNSDSITLLHGLKREIARSTVRKQDSPSDPLTSPNHAAVTWSYEDDEVDLLVNIDTETSDFEEAIRNALADDRSGVNPWFELQRRHKIFSKEDLEEIPGLPYPLVFSQVTTCS